VASRNSFFLGRNHENTHSTIKNAISHLVQQHFSKFMPEDEIGDAVHEAVNNFYSPTHTEEGNFSFAIHGIRNDMKRTFVATSNFLRCNVPTGRTMHYVIVYPPKNFHGLLETLAIGHVASSRSSDDHVRQLLPFLSPTLREEFRLYDEAKNNPTASRLDAAFISTVEKFTDLFDDDVDVFDPSTNILKYVPSVEESKEDHGDGDPVESNDPIATYHVSTDFSPQDFNRGPTVPTTAPAVVSQEESKIEDMDIPRLGMPAVSNPMWGSDEEIEVSFTPTYASVTSARPDPSHERSGQSSEIPPNPSFGNFSSIFPDTISHARNQGSSTRAPHAPMTGQANVIHASRAATRNDVGPSDPLPTTYVNNNPTSNQSQVPTAIEHPDSATVHTTSAISSTSPPPAPTNSTVAPAAPGPTSISTGVDDSFAPDPDETTLEPAVFTSSPHIAPLPTPLPGTMVSVPIHRPTTSTAPIVNPGATIPAAPVRAQATVFPTVAAPTPVAPTAPTTSAHPPTAPAPATTSSAIPVPAPVPAPAPAPVPAPAPMFTPHPPPVGFYTPPGSGRSSNGDPTPPESAEMNEPPPDSTINGVDWRMHRVDPNDVDAHLDPTTQSIRPWRFPRPETNSTINFPVQFRAYQCDTDTYIDSLHRKLLGEENYTVKNFLYSFPKLRDDASAGDIFEFLNEVTRYASGYAVYCPPPHTMIPQSNRGNLYHLLPNHCHEYWQYYDSVIRLALISKQAGLGYSELTKPVLYERSGYQMLWRLAYFAGHPRLSENFVDPGLPRQKSGMDFTQYHAEWFTRLHLHYYQGTFLSDRYFAETFVKNMSTAFNGTKSHIHAQIRRVPISMSLPMMFQPENIVGFICNTVKLIGIDDLTPLSTPREFMESHSRSRRKPESTSSSNTRSLTKSVRQMATDNVDDDEPSLDIRQTDTFWSLDEDIQLSIHSLAAATHNQRQCHGCGASDHLFVQCPKLKSLVETNPSAAKRMIDVIQKALVPAGISSSPPHEDST
jgi:hypothetical protein